MIRSEILYITISTAVLIILFLSWQLKLVIRQNKEWKKDYKKLSDAYRDLKINCPLTNKQTREKLILIRNQEKNKNKKNVES
jgi:hypothetical protein